MCQLFVVLKRKYIKDCLVIYVDDTFAANLCAIGLISASLNKTFTKIPLEKSPAQSKTI